MTAPTQEQISEAFLGLQGSPTTAWDTVIAALAKAGNELANDSNTIGTRFWNTGATLAQGAKDTYSAITGEGIDPNSTFGKASKIYESLKTDESKKTLLDALVKLNKGGTGAEDRVDLRASFVKACEGKAPWQVIDLSARALSATTEFKKQNNGNSKFFAFELKTLPKSGGHTAEKAKTYTANSSRFAGTHHVNRLQKQNEKNRNKYPSVRSTSTTR